MNFAGATLLCLLSTAIPPFAAAQNRLDQKAQASSRATPSTAKPAGEYSTEPYVIEEYKTAFRFENDGTGERTLTARIRIQNDVAAKTAQ